MAGDTLRRACRSAESDPSVITRCHSLQSGSGRCGAAASDTGSPGSGWAASRPDGYPRPA